MTFQRPDSSAHGISSSIRNWFSVLTFLMVRNLAQNTRAGRFSTLFMLAEPLLFIVAIYYLRGMIRGISSQYGTSLFLFLASGFLPFFFFFRVSVQTMGGTRSTQRTLPRINSMDTFIANIAVTTLIWITMIGIIFTGMWLYGIDQARPQSTAYCLLSLSMLMMLGCAISLINSSIARYFPFWQIFTRRTTRGLFFFSGVMHLAITYPPWLKEWLLWNPVLHAIELFRVGVYGFYPTVLDWDYLLKSTLILFFLGLVADRATLRYASRYR